MTNEGRTDVDFRFRLSPEEAEIVERVPHPPQSLILLGRSGTGAVPLFPRQRSHAAATIGFHCAALPSLLVTRNTVGGRAAAPCQLPLDVLPGHMTPRAPSAAPAAPPRRQDHVRGVPHV